MFRRFLDVEERVFLKKCRVVSETQCDLGLNALKLVDVLDLMENEYSEKFDEFSTYLEEKRHKAFLVARINQTQQIKQAYKKANSTLSNSGKGMKEMIRKAMQSVANYNMQLIIEKKEERSTCFDLQTMVFKKHILKKYF